MSTDSVFFCFHPRLYRLGTNSVLTSFSQSITTSQAGATNPALRTSESICPRTCANGNWSSRFNDATMLSHTAGLRFCIIFKQSAHNCSNVLSHVSELFCANRIHPVSKGGKQLSVSVQGCCTRRGVKSSCNRAHLTLMCRCILLSEI